MRSKSKERGLKYSNVKTMVEKRSASFSAPYLKIPEGAKLFKPKAGIMLLDILPYKAGEDNPWAEEGVLHWERTFWVHRGVGANSESYLCLRKNYKSKCPICEFRAKLEREGEDDTEDMRKALAPRERQLFNVFNRKEPDKGVQLWDFSYHMFGKLLQARIRDGDEEDGWDLFFTLDEGLTLKVGFGEKSYAGRAYFEAETIDFKPRQEPYEEDILDEVFDLDDLLVAPDYDELKKAFLESSEDEPSSRKSKKHKTEDEDEEEEDKPKRRRVHDEDEEEEEKPRRKKKDEEDEDEEEPRRKSKKDEEEDEEEEKPRRKKKDEEDDFDDFEDFDDKKKSKKKDEDDEEPEDEDKPRRRKHKAEDEEEEDEKPRRKKKSDEDEEEPEDEEEKPRRKKKDEDDEWEERPRIKTRDEEEAELAEEEEDKPRRRKRRD